MLEVVRELYSVFEPYRLGNDFTGCDCCVKKSDTECLSTTPLNELAVADLDLYSFKAMTTWGEVRHYKHFLPRLLELAYDQFLEFNSPEVLLSKLTYADWQAWPESERDALAQYFKCFWIHQLNTDGYFPFDERIISVLGGLAEVFASLSDFLITWQNCTDLNPALHCAQLVTDSADEIVRKGTVSLWGRQQHQTAEIIDWLSSTNPEKLMQHQSGTIATIFPDVRDQLERIRRSTTTP